MKEIDNGKKPPKKRHGGETYRCLLKDGRAVMKFINPVKIYYELHSAVKDRC